MHQPYKTVDKEVEIFEKTKEAQVHDHAENEEEFPFMRFFGSSDKLSEIEVHKSGDHDETQEPPVPPAIKDIAGY